jgi:DNA polymerase-3 subunit epsilon
MGGRSSTRSFAPQAVHGISTEDCAKAPYWEDLSDQVRSILHGRPVIAFNMEFDHRIINQTCRLSLVDELSGDFHCAMHAFGAFIGQKRWPKLEQAAKHFGIKLGNHRAFDDAECCRKVVLAMAECYNGRN